MQNKVSAIEWLKIAYHDLQQSCEKSLKSILAYENKKIKKSHELVDIYALVQYKINLNNYLELLEKATGYFKEDRYPNPNYCLPPREEIKEVLEFTEELFEKVCKILDINIEEVKV